MEHPLTSIIVINLNGGDVLKRCIQSIVLHTKPSYELIVVDNGSNDDSLDFLNSLPGIQIIQNETNAGAPMARNQAMAVSRGDPLMFLDNDTIVPPGWLENFLDHLQNLNVALIGPRSNRVSGHQLAPGADYSDYDSFLEFSKGFMQQRKGNIAQTRRLILFAMMVRRSVLEAIGGYDPGYGKWGYEDDDYVLRAAKKGFDSYIAHDVFIHHDGSGTEGKADLNYSELLATNRSYFLNKFGIDEQTVPSHTIPVKEILQQDFGEEVLYTPLPEDREIQPMMKQTAGSRNQPEPETLTGHRFEGVRSKNDLYPLLEFELARERPKVVLEYGQQAMKADPGDAHVQFFVAYALVQLNYIDRAGGLVSHILENHPDNLNALNLLSIILWRQGKKDRAIQVAEKVIELDSENQDARSNLQLFRSPSNQKG